MSNIKNLENQNINANEENTTAVNAEILEPAPEWAGYYDTVSENTPKQDLVILLNKQVPRFPTTSKEYMPFMIRCDVMVHLAEKMLKKFHKESEQYNFLSEAAFRYAELKLEAQYALGQYFKSLEKAQGRRTDLDPNEPELPFPEGKKLTKEQKLKQDYGISVKTAWQLEQLTPELIEETIKKASIKKDLYLPTLSLAMSILEEKKKEKQKEHKKDQAAREKEQKELAAKAKKDMEKFYKLHKEEPNALSSNLFNVIYIDPFINNLNWDSLKGTPLPVDENAVLAIWCDSSNLENALSLIQSWKFVYQDMAVWDYRVSATGSFVNKQHRILLFATNGKGLSPDEKEKSVLTLHKDEAEQATSYYYDLLERMFPDGAYLDMCANKAHNDKWTLFTSINNTTTKGE